MNKKKLNLLDLTSIGVGTVIGAGIFSMMGYGIAYTGRGITLAYFIAMALVVAQSLRLPILTNVFDVDGGSYGISALVCPRFCAGIDAANSMFFKMGTQSVTAIAFTMYLEVLFPVLIPYRKVVAIAVLSVVFLCAAVGDKFAAQAQNVMCFLMYTALALFVVYGFMNFNASAYAGEPLLPNGVSGLMMASALMSYTCNGFQMVVSVGRGAENPQKDIPRAFFLAAFISAAIYAVIGFATTHMFSYGQTAGQNLGDLAKLIMPTALYMFFLVGGALFALGTSMLGNITAGYRPLMISAQDGWLPSVIGKTTKTGIPYVFGVLYVLSVIPVLLGWDLNDMVTMQLVPMGTIGIINNLFSLNVPERFPKEWAASSVKMSAGLYKVIILISCVASGTLVAYAFLSNGYKALTLGITVCLIAYGYLRDKFGHIELQAQKEYASKSE